MRMLLVMSQFIPYHGGTASNLACFKATLRRYDHAVAPVMICQRSAWAAQTVSNGVPVTRVSGIYRRGSLGLGYGRATMVYLNAACTLPQHIQRAGQMGAVPTSHAQATFSPVNAIDRFAELAGRLMARANQHPPEATR